MLEEFAYTQRPEMVSDRLGYPTEYGDADWAKHQNFWDWISPINQWSPKTGMRLYVAQMDRQAR